MDAFLFFLKEGRIAPFSKYPATSGRVLTNVSKTIVTVAPFPSKILCSVELYTICNEMYIPYNTNCVRHTEITDTC